MRLQTVPEDEQEKENSQAGERHASLRDTHTGLTRHFGKPIVDKTKESLANRAEEIQSQYQQLKTYKSLAVSGVTGAVGDLLELPEKKKTGDDDENSLDDLLGNNSKTEKKESKD